MQILRQDIMQDSSVYQDILETGRKKGLEEGLQTGRQEGEAKLVLRL
jgi:predicted transposase YdaD